MKMEKNGPNKKKAITDDDAEKRDTWNNPIEFFLTLIAYNVGPGNILRFPYLCMRNGGAAFLVPYFICLFVIGMPLYTLELIIGQSTSRSCTACWEKYSPLFKGIGYTMVIITGLCAFEFQTYMAWILYFFARSLTLELPWTTCDASWNTENCILTTNYTAPNLTIPVYYSVNESDYNNFTGINVTERSTAVEEFFQNEVLRLSSGIESIGGLQWQLVLAHVVGWVICVGCLFKGIRSSGKVVYVSATVPCVIITIFLIRAALLPGFSNGIDLYLTPNFEALKKPEVWMMAFVQIFYSLGPGWGCVISMASFSQYNHNFLYEAILSPLTCCLTSFYAGLVTFGAAGFLGHMKGMPPEQAMKSGPGIAFISFPEMAAHLPGAPFWSALFFLMMINVAIGTQIIQIETCVSAITDAFDMPKHKHKYVLLSFALMNVLGGLVFFTGAGMYIFQLIDWYFALIVVFAMTAFECIIVFWVYGFDKFQNDVFSMIGRKPWKWVVIPHWGIFLPAICAFSIVWGIVTIPPPVFGKYVFPDWCRAVGWCLAFSTLVPTVLHTLWQLFQIRGPGFRGELRKLVWPPVSSETPEPESVPMNMHQASVQL